MNKDYKKNKYNYSKLKTQNTNKYDLASYLNDYKFSTSKILYMLEQFASKPHPLGSDRQKELHDWMIIELEKMDVDYVSQEFAVKVPNPCYVYGKECKKNEQKDDPNTQKFLNLTARNLIAKIEGSKDCSVMFGSHYDTEKLYKSKNIDYLGANDSASSSAGLFGLIKYYQQTAHHGCNLLFVWFDGEESYLIDWFEGKELFGILDNTYGSRHFSKQLIKKQISQDQFKYHLPTSIDPNSNELSAVIILDMIGSRNIKFTIDNYSDKTLMSYLKSSVKELKFDEDILDSRDLGILDDHIPFVVKKIPAIVLIDFYNDEHWHKLSDTSEKIDYFSIIKALKLAIMIEDKFSSSILD